MLSLGPSLAFSIDSLCVSAAVRIHYPDDNLKWQLPLAFALCDGLAAFCGLLVHARQLVDREAGLVISVATYGVSAGLVLMVAKWRRSNEPTAFRRAVTLAAIPLLLGTADNFRFVKQYFPGTWTPVKALL